MASITLDRMAVIHAFDRYVSAYNAQDPKIKLKIDHTYRVAALCERISQGIANLDLAWLCGMLHDIGRFEQVVRYGTFVDAVSVDHAAFGADLLFKEGLINTFSLNGLSTEDMTMLECAIRSHSAYRIDDTLSDAQKTCCNILRDADKIDIFRVNCDTPMEVIYNVTTEALKNASVSEAVMRCFQNRTAVPRAWKRTPIDYLVAHLCLVFELVFPVSRTIAREQGYVDRMLSFESDNPETRAWFNYMKYNIWKIEGTTC